MLEYFNGLQLMNVNIGVASYHEYEYAGTAVFKFDEYIHAFYPKNSTALDMGSSITVLDGR